MDAPDIQKHLNAEIARLVMELATAKAVIEQLEKSLAEVKAGGSGTPNGAQGADGSEQEGSPV